MPFESYRNYLLCDRQIGENTASNYLYFLSKLGEFIPTPLEDATKEDIRDFLRHNKERGIKNSTISTYIAGFRSYYNYLSAIQNVEKVHPLCFFLNNILRIKMERSVRQVPTTYEIQRLRRTMHEYKNLYLKKDSMFLYKITVRDISIIELFCGVGLRSKEIRGIRLGDLDLENYSVFILNGKGGHQRESIFDDYVKNSLEEYINISSFKEDNILFPFSASLLRYIIKRWTKKANINDRIHPHSFRHFHITEAQRRGISIQLVADQVGHVNLNTTRRYTHLDLEHRREQYRKNYSEKIIHSGS